MVRKSFAVLAIALLGAWSVTAAPVSSKSAWSSFFSIGSGVSVSSTQVNGTTCAWKFRNDGSTKITHMKYTYTYVDADTHLSTTDVDYMAGTLAPGAVFGGWAAYSANTRSCPTQYKILAITRA